MRSASISEDISSIRASGIRPICVHQRLRLVVEKLCGGAQEMLLAGLAGHLKGRARR